MFSSLRRRPGEPPPSSAPDDVVHLLLRCHERIRRFTALALATGTRVDVPPGEVSEACQRLVRYFGEALPLHVADEEESIAPRLVGRSHELDEALATMEGEHTAHVSALKKLLRAAAAVQADPASTRHRALLAGAASELSVAFNEHLALEEAVIFPAIQQLLSPETRREIIDEIRARRGSTSVVD